MWLLQWILSPNINDAEKVMKRIVKLKYDQVPEFKELVDANKGKSFVEATRNPKWGIGLPFTSELIYQEMNWKGQNLMGKIITELAT